MPDAARTASRPLVLRHGGSALQGTGAAGWQKRLGQTTQWEATMSVARVTEIISASDQSFEHAVREGVERANQTLENIKEAWIASQKVVVESGKIVEYRVTLKVTFVLR
jgi:hypothetical protein